MAFPGPVALGRGVVVHIDAPVPEVWRDAPVVTIDDAALADPRAVVDQLHRLWVARAPGVVALGVDPGRFRSPESITDEVWRLTADTEPFFDRLHFLVWANNYDARAAGDPIWWWGRKAARLGAIETPGGPADVVLDDGTAAFIDGGPRGPVVNPADPGVGGPPRALPEGSTVIASETVDAGRLTPDVDPRPPTAELAPDQLAAVTHRAGPVRVIAPAGSGKTRVLTERLRHLVIDRGWGSDSVLTVAFNKQAQLEAEARTRDFQPRVRTLNSLGLWVLRQHRGSMPRVLDERECRRIIDSLLPGKRVHRANTDPIGPYLEALGSVRLGLCAPNDVESMRDDVDGFAELFGPYRQRLADQGAVDFDEQIYGAIEVLLRDGAFRRSIQAQCRHLLVDEFQDLTPAHVLLVRLCALPALDVFGVGDDDQVIYGHNSADPGFLIDYDALFPGAASHPLTVNYRCPTAVVDAARNLVGYNHRRVDKTITAGPTADDATDRLVVTHHEPTEASAALLDTVRGWLDTPDVAPAQIAVLCRVNSLLLAPQIALVDAGYPVSSVLAPNILARTGLRAALAYLRLAMARDRMAAADITEILRRPTRGLPRWFPDRLEGRAHWSLSQLRAIADRVADKDARKVERLADDLALVAAAARHGTTRGILEVVRDEIGLGSAMGLLDHSGASGGQGSSHCDDLEGLLAVADLHPDPVGFEAWLSDLLARPDDPGGITLSTIHRVKGREWDHVVIVGVVDGIVPHRLAVDIEEERRVLHVGITRGRRRVAVLADRSRPSRFVDELAGTAPKSRPRPTGASGTAAASTAGARSAGGQRASASTKRGRAETQPGHVATLGLCITASGGHTGDVEGADGSGVLIRLAGGGTLRVRYGERVEVDGVRRPLSAPVELWGDAAAAETALRAWRTGEAKAGGKPAYTVLSDAHLRGIALARPTSAAELAACDGIGPVKLERWADDILAALDEVG
ncbi:MAG: ATP-dependent DNA helicase UvrD2 [Actinobacteria bacterium]|nr:ATP-dependent DNA helicase UvrD2 [Actinomycetota bacterium]